MIIIFNNLSQQYLMLKDVYVDFFRLGIMSQLSTDEVVSAIVSEYDITSHEVEADYRSFIAELKTALSSAEMDEEGLGEEEVGEISFLPESYVYNIMTEKTIPFSATLEITDNCNENCIHCYRGVPQKSYWNTANFRNTIEELRKLGTLQMTLTGGEPCLHPDFAEMLQIVARNDFVLSVQTNATAFTDEILASLRTCIVDKVAISLYSVENTVHDAITKLHGSCELTKRGIEKLLRFGFPVKVNCPVMPNNKDSMLALKRYCAGLGVKCNFAFKIIPSRYPGKDTAGLNVFSSEFLLDCMRNEEIKLYSESLHKMRQYRDQVEDRYCQTGFRSITFNPQGECLICNSFVEPCGNLSEMSVYKIWNESEGLKKWREVTSLVNKKCKNCPAYGYCGPCPSYFHTLTGRTDSIDNITCSIGNALFEADQKYIKFSTDGSEEK
jgi:radical SAM protein with 4Fe4S-binding SPASM domain